MANTEVIQALVDRLRSGEEIQGHNKLEQITDDGIVKRCCLGVLSHMAFEAGICDRGETPDGEIFYGDVSRAHNQEYWNSDVLPQPVMDWAGLQDDNPIFDSKNRQSLEHYWSFAELNDEQGWDFDQIADAFEQQYLSE